MNIFLHELKLSRKSIFIWNVSLAAAALLYLSMYPTFAGEAAVFQKALMNFPQAYLKALGIHPDSYTSINGFYALIVGYVTLAASIQAMNIGTGIVSKEERWNTAEFLLAKPIARSQILKAKLATGLFITLLTSAIFAATARFFIATVGRTSIDFGVFALLSATVFFVQLFFMALGFLISVSAKKVKSVLSISLSTVFGFYIVGMLDSLLDARFIRYLTPFKFFDLQYIARHRSFEWRFILLEAAFIAAVVTAGFVIYQRRDIRGI